MPRGNTVTFGNKTFPTQKKAEDYVRNILETIGVCNSVKEYDTELFQDLLDVLQRHPQSKIKLQGMKDISIQRNKLNLTAYEIYIVKEYGIEEDISWKYCVTGKEKTAHRELCSALRYSVEDQILSYKAKNPKSICTLCGKYTKGNTQVDHVIHFEKLVQDFHTEWAKAVPSVFSEAMDGTNRSAFLLKDEAYENAWKRYHMRKAQLRIVCPRCNLTREKLVRLTE